MGEGCIVNFYALMQDHLSICMCKQMLLAFLTRISLYTKHTFLIGCGYMAGHLYSFLFTLVTPILSDQFGFSVEYTSHFLIGFSVAFCLSSFVQ